MLRFHQSQRKNKLEEHTTRSNNRSRSPRSSSPIPKYENSIQKINHFQTHNNLRKQMVQQRSFIPPVLNTRQINLNPSKNNPPRSTSVTSKKLKIEGNFSTSDMINSTQMASNSCNNSIILSKPIPRIRNIKNNLNSNGGIITKHRPMFSKSESVLPMGPLSIPTTSPGSSLVHPTKNIDLSSVNSNSLKNFFKNTLGIKVITKPEKQATRNLNHSTEVVKRGYQNLPKNDEKIIQTTTIQTNTTHSHTVTSTRNQNTDSGIDTNTHNPARNAVKHQNLRSINTSNNIFFKNDQPRIVKNIPQKPPQNNRALDDLDSSKQGELRSFVLYDNKQHSSNQNINIIDKPLRRSKNSKNRQSPESIKNDSYFHRARLMEASLSGNSTPSKNKPFITPQHPFKNSKYLRGNTPEMVDSEPLRRVNQLKLVKQQLKPNIENKLIKNLKMKFQKKIFILEAKLEEQMILNEEISKLIEHKDLKIEILESKIDNYESFIDQNKREKSEKQVQSLKALKKYKVYKKDKEKKGQLQIEEIVSENERLKEKNMILTQLLSEVSVPSGRSNQYINQVQITQQFKEGSEERERETFSTGSDENLTDRNQKGEKYPVMSTQLQFLIEKCLRSEEYMKEQSQRIQQLEIKFQGQGKQ